ncbi:unnamed protein product [Strongylus vulgaris]|uniref:Sushi domain-containing protein n=1 Tax=Strongylus vulgaris TaxID=40348 RepID=A0A3P7KIQ7_STRVU|nr:unnamed protein product [Strongylus vulgaris]
MEALKISGICPAPVASPFGEVTFSETSSFSSSRFSSRDSRGLTLYYRQALSRPFPSPPALVALFDHFWENALTIENMPLNCLPLAPPANGRVIVLKEALQITYIQSGKLDNFEVGATALLYCLESFVVTGQATAACAKDGWQPSSCLGKCDTILQNI